MYYIILILKYFFIYNNKGPMAEIEFWRNRNSSVSALFEQLNISLAHKIIDILNATGSPITADFEYQFSELNKLYTEAKDNVKFLSTLERHFKGIIVGSLSSVTVIYINNLKKK